MRTSLVLFLLAPLPVFGQAMEDLPLAPGQAPPTLQLSAFHHISAAEQNSSTQAQLPFLDPTNPGELITRSQAETFALKNNPRITASNLLELADGQVTRQTRSNELPQAYGQITAEKAEDDSRIGAGSLTDSHLFTHAGAGGTFSQLLTDFGHTRSLVATNELQQKARTRPRLQHNKMF